MGKIKVWINGRILNAGAAAIPVFDRGFLYGDGLFETMRCYDGKAFLLYEHLSRLFASAKVLKIKIPYSRGKLERTIRGILAANRLEGAHIRITVTRGEGAFTFGKDNPTKPNVVISIKEFNGLPEAFYSRGITVAVSTLRQNEYSPLSGVKSLNFLNHILARAQARDAGFDEAILTNIKGHVAEAATSNIFLVRKGRLITPSLDTGILPGITRKVVIRIARRLKVPVEERRVSCVDLAVADEVFLTNSVAEILPVIKIGRFPVGSGSPGEITKLLHAAYRQMI